MSVSLLVELSESKLRCAVNRDKQVKFAFFSAHFSDIDVEVADRYRLNAFLRPVQQHSVRGFLAGVVRKRLKLKLASKKVDGQRIYQIASADSGKSGVRQSKRRSS